MKINLIQQRKFFFCKKLSEAMKAWSEHINFYALGFIAEMQAHFAVGAK